MTILIPCRDAEAEEMPTGAARLAKTAAASGWRCRTTYAKAEIDDKVIESVLVRLRLTPFAAVGAWHNGKFALAYIGSTVTSPRRIGARELTRFVKEVVA